MDLMEDTIYTHGLTFGGHLYIGSNFQWLILKRWRSDLVVSCI